MATNGAAQVPSRRRCHCHMCDAEVAAVPDEDLELSCEQCGSTCVELLADGPQPLPQPPLLSSVTQVQHAGVICDGCQARDFTGIRYRCTVCADFDLCDRCYAQRNSIHPNHRFEEMRNPRNLMQTFFGTPEFRDMAARSLNHTIVTVMEINLEDENPNVQSGLDDTQVSWWLAGDERLVDAQVIASQDPNWTCPICSEGMEAEGSNGWLVRICTTEPNPSTGAKARPGRVSKDADEDGSNSSNTDGHLYHEECLRKWLLTKNACPVCRRTPVVPTT